VAGASPWWPHAGRLGRGGEAAATPNHPLRSELHDDSCRSGACRQPALAPGGSEHSPGAHPCSAMLLATAATLVSPGS
jgi:hypothetical protein